jgi:hypothetical protein
MISSTDNKKFVIVGFCTFSIGRSMLRRYKLEGHGFETR